MEVRHMPHYRPIAALMAPAPPAAPGTRRALLPLTPPSAYTSVRWPGAVPCRAMQDHLSGPRAGASGWLAVGNSGDRNTTSAPFRLARNRLIRSCAELVRICATGSARRPRQPSRR